MLTRGQSDVQQDLRRHDTSNCASRAAVTSPFHKFTRGVSTLLPSTWVQLDSQALALAPKLNAQSFVRSSIDQTRGQDSNRAGFHTQVRTCSRLAVWFR